MAKYSYTGQQVHKKMNEYISAVLENYSNEAEMTPSHSAI